MTKNSSASVQLRPMSVLYKVLRWARPYWISYALLSGIIFLSALIPVGTAEGMRRLINAVFNRSLSEMWVAAGVLGAVPLGGLVLNFARAWLMQRLSNRTTLDLQREVLGRLFLTSLLRLGKSHTGDKVQRLNESAVKAQDGINQHLPKMIERILSILFLFIYLTVLSWVLLVGALVISFIVPLISNLMAKPIRKWQQKENESQGLQDSKLQDQMQGAEVVRSFGLRASFNTSWIKRVAATRLYSIRTHMWQLTSALTIFAGYWIGQLYILGLGAWMVQDQLLTIGVIAAFMVSYEQLVYPLSHLINFWAAIQDALAHAGRVFAMADPTESKPTAEGYAQLPNQENVVMDRVTFGYEEGDPILQEFSIAFKHGCTTALVGPTGGGKSTIMKLVLGLYAPEEGEISLGGVAVGQRTMGTWRDRIAYVPQDVALLDATVIENIRVGRLDATREEIMQAAQLAQADEFIRALPEQYETRLGERGQRLSGGERQRLAIARAYVRNPNILLLDEPTSALDGRNEHLIQKALGNLMENRTVIIIAHRLSTVRQADHIAFINEGRVIESGTHEELMEWDGRYAELVQAGNWADIEELEGERI